MTTVQHQTAFGRRIAPLLQKIGVNFDKIAFVTFAAAATLGSYFYVVDLEWQKAEAAFRVESEKVTREIAARMSIYEDALLQGVSVHNLMTEGAQEHLTRDQWRGYSRLLDLENKYPGINGIGVIYAVPDAEIGDFESHHRAAEPDFAIHPVVETDMHYPIVYIEPEGRNRVAIGLDIAFEERRSIAIAAAADSGRTRMTAPIALVQDNQSSPGFLLFAPLYNEAANYPTHGGRFAGAIYAPFVMHRLIAGTLGLEFRTVRMDIRDGADLLYSDAVGAAGAHLENPLFSTTIDLPVFGRTWTIDLETTAGFQEINASRAPLLVLLIGLLVDVALSMAYFNLSRRAHNADETARALNDALQIEKRELEASDLALEHFNYLSSHDLRTPLRGMHDVADDLAADLKDHFPNTMTEPRIILHLNVLHSLIGDLDKLISGMVAFALVGRNKADQSRFDTGTELQRIIGTLRTTGAVIELSGDLPDVLCNRELFGLIVTNLVSNAVSRHPKPVSAHITVACQAIGRTMVLQVEDDGDGIPTHLQWQIFDMLRLESNDAAQDGGLGLAIVKRAASAIGGYVTVSSEPGKRTCFTVMLIDVIPVNDDPVPIDAVQPPQSPIGDAA